MVTIYILELENGKYYVGRTVNADLRIDKHFNHNGSYWTAKHKPRKVIRIMNNCNIYDEDKYTLQMMAQYGVDNVRGGSFTKIILPDNEIEVITKMINNANDHCFNCYENHFVRDCPYELFNNMQMVILKNKLFDVYYDEFIEIDELVKILIESDKTIFKELEEKNIYSLCKRINKYNFKGVEEINEENIRYDDFVVGLVCLLDKKIDDG